jgi:hypothetical protein
MNDEQLESLERRVEHLERRLELLEQGEETEGRHNRRARSMNMWLRIGVYVSFVLLMVLFLVVFKVRF